MGYQVRSLAAVSDSDRNKRDHALNVLWFDPDACADPERSGLDRQRQFPGGDSAVAARSAWDDSDAAFLGFKAGDDRTDHGALDVGTFVFDVGGVRWATDLGSNDYSLPGYWDMDAGRWRYYRKRAEGHDTLVVDPDGEPDQDPTASCPLVRVEAGDDAVLAMADLSPAYPGASVERGVGLVDGRSRLVVRDEIEADGADVWWFLHTETGVDADGPAAALEGDGRRMRAAIASPADAAFEMRDRAAAVLARPDGGNARRGRLQARRPARRRRDDDADGRTGARFRPGGDSVALSEWSVDGTLGPE